MADQNIEAIHPLTPLQEGILFESLNATNPGAYFNQYSCLLEGSIDAQAMQQAWSVVIERHAVLRALFTWEKRDKPLQIVRRRVNPPWQVLDWRECTGDEQSLRLENFLQQDREQGFSLDTAPLMRLTLVYLSASQARLIWSFHHIVLDGWSMRLIFDEVRVIYVAVVEGIEHDLEPAPNFYDFVARQLTRDETRDAEFWQQRLAGFRVPTTPEIALGSDHDAATAGPGHSTERILDSKTSERLRALAKSNRVTLNTVCSAAWSLLLARYCDTDDIVFGATVAGRSAEIKNTSRTAGLFINTLPVRARLGADVTFADLLRQLQAQQVAQQEYEQTPLTAIHGYSDLPAQTPLFESILVFENLRQATAGKSDQLLVHEARFIEYSNFPLAILIVPDAELNLIVVYDSRRYSHAAVNRLLRHFEQILMQFVVQPQPELAVVSLLTDAEQQTLVRQWNDTQLQQSSAASVVQLFERCVARDPAAIAVTSDGAMVSYDELNRKANQLAHFLQRTASIRGKPLVVYAQRSAEAIVGMLAALKAGATYVPMDVNDPTDRLQQVLTDLGSAYREGNSGYKPVTLTERPLVDRVPPDSTLMVLLQDVPDQEADSNPQLEIDQHSLAYIIYTSGSTGRPKGVMISHSALLNSTLARLHFYAEPVSSFALLSSLATDSSIAGIYWTLCTGGNLVMPAQRAELDIGQLALLIDKNRISHTLCVPSLYDLIIEHADPALLESLSVVIIAGEAGSCSLVRRHHETLPGAALYNEYGPSEACVWASVARLEPGDARTGITIGRPIANTRLYVLDKDRRQLPVGVAGEIFIGGENLASGYLGRNDTTRAAFVADAFAGNGSLLYRTGDRARLRDDGCVEYLGRVDHQLKVRGYRVEPGEIETVLASHADVDSAVVFIDESAALDKELAVLVGRVGETAASALLAEIDALDDVAVERALDAAPHA